MPPWRPERTRNLLKIKPYDDCEATIIGYVCGRKTDKESRWLGMLGTMKCRLDNGIEFECSGFTEQERGFRSLTDDNHITWCRENHGKEVPRWIESTTFTRGERITVKYMGLSADGVPQSANYLRKDVRI